MNNKITLINSLRADWGRLSILMGRPEIPLQLKSFFSPRFVHIVLIRCSHTLYIKNHLNLAKVLSLLNFLIFGIEVPSCLSIGPGLVIPHPQGIVMGANVIGSNLTIFHQVTLGAKSLDFSYDLKSRPIILNNVTISTGAKILGSVIIGNSCVIGANAVVLVDIPDNSRAVGVPAKITHLALNSFEDGL
ncbi:hypothetical protein AOC10_01785 [Polynucleobacter asymbioticus]|uniref:serine O-acetyltransferase n=1 Tax=Polynucleobacter asymbioticus TaxID=576611 RepID=UPI0008FB86C6|nr:hypothetical protein [Polynucleobacter asymbioticus]APC05347.1 hypothetical protein AOC10_01785 [Polynucleobacter asymbioticus]